MSEDQKRITSKDYWDLRYARGLSSGSGSGGKLAQFKAEILNGFLQEHRIQSAAELGCGDGHQASLIQYPNYTGFDISEIAVSLCRERNTHIMSRNFFHYMPGKMNTLPTAELAVSLDVLYHIVEDDVFKTYINDLFSMAQKFVIIYSTDYEAPPYFHYSRHRRFTVYLEYVFPSWKLLKQIPQRFPNEACAEFFIYEKISIGADSQTVKQPALS